MILRVSGARNCNNPLATDPGSCQRRISAARMTSREATLVCNLPLVPWKGITESARLLAEDENTSLARKSDFPYLSILSKQHGIIVGLGAAVFPSAFGFGTHVLAFLDGGLVSFDLQPVFAGFQLGLSEFRGLRNVDRLVDASCKCRYRHCDGGKQSNRADKH